MGKKHGAKSGGAAAVVLKKHLDKKAQAKKAQPVESDNESEDSGNYMTFNKKDKDSDDEEDREVFNLALDKDEDDEDDESEEDSEDDSEGSDDSEEEEEDGSEEDDDEDSDDSEEDLEGDELKQLVDNLPTKLRQQIRKKAENDKRRKAGMEVESEEDSEQEESEQEEGWGKKKKTYWQGDTADLEIGQEMDDAIEEEEAAQELHREKTKRMKASDFMDEFAASGSDDASDDSTSASDSDADSSAPVTKGGKGKSSGKAKASKRADAVVGDLAQVSLGQDDLASDDDAAVQVERVSKNLAHLTKQQRLDLITKNSPEMLGIVEELKDLIGDLKGRILPIKEYIKKIASTHQVQDDVVDYLEVKQQLLLTYCINVVFYLYMKAQGKSVANHPVMKQLLKLRYVMEKMRPLDGKLKHQVDRLVQLAELSPQDLSQHTDLLRPNPFALLSASSGDAKASKSKASKSSKKAAKADYSDDEEEGSESEVEDDSEGDAEAKSEVYKVPKRTAVPYKESETELDRRDKRLEKQKSKLKRSELMDTLRDEFGTAPEAAASSGLGMQSGDLRKLQEEKEEREKFEEDRFVRMTMSRKDKKDIKRRTAEASRLDNFDDIGDIGDFEEMSKLASMSGHGNDMSADADLRGASKSSSKQSTSVSSALQRAVMALGQSDASNGAKGSKKSNLRAMAEELGDDDSDDPYSALLAAGPGGDDGNNRKRRRAPTSSMDSDMENDFGAGGDDDEMDDDGENLLEDFSQKKKKFLAEKKAHYTAEPQYGGFQESVQEGGKRAASYEIIKNKGLTPHRKKANRNPRVKKREMYDKAVIRRKGQVRDVVTGAAGAYAGELTGIKANVARSRKIGV